MKHFNAVDLFREGGFENPDLRGYKASMAVMHAMQSGHTAAEAALKRILDILGEEHPTGEDWHDILIRRLARAVTGAKARPAVLPPDVAADLHETRRFRHRAMHSYENFDTARFGPTLASAERLRDTLARTIVTFRGKIDPEV